MLNRNFWYVSGVTGGVIFVAVITFKMLAAPQISTTSPISLQPAGWFEVPRTEPSQVLRDFGVNEGALYFLVTGPTGAQIIRTDTAGRLAGPSKMLAGSYAGTGLLRIDNSGAMAVLLNRSGSEQLLLLDPTKEGPSPIALRHHGTDFAFVDHQLIGLDESDSSLWLEAEQRQVFSLSPPLEGTDHRLIPMPDHCVAVLEANLPRLRVADVRTGATRLIPTELSAPEIQAPMRPTPPPNVSPVIAYSAAADERGNIFCAISPRPLKTPIVLEFDDQGTLKTRLRCTMPALPELVTKLNPNGYPLAWRIAVLHGTLFIASQRDNRCVYYSLPTERRPQ